MPTNTQEDDPEINSVPCLLDQADDSIVQYIDYLHDRIQFLTEELEQAEREVLKLREQNPTNSVSGDGSTVDTDIQNISRYIRYLAHRFETDERIAKRYARLLAEVLEDEIDDVTDLHNASLALWAILKQHEEMASG